MERNSYERCVYESVDNNNLEPILGYIIKNDVKQNSVYKGKIDQNQFCSKYLVPS